MARDELPPAEELQIEPFDSAAELEAFVRGAVIVSVLGLVALFLLGFTLGILVAHATGVTL